MASPVAAVRSGGEGTYCSSVCCALFHPYTLTQFRSLYLENGVTHSGPDLPTAMNIIKQSHVNMLTGQANVDDPPGDSRISQIDN